MLRLGHLVMLLRTYCNTHKTGFFKEELKFKLSVFSFKKTDIVLPPLIGFHQ